MFKKLVSSLPFSPSLIGQLGFYARRLKKETFIRRLGLIFTAFALIIQSFAVFSPPESVNAASGNDLVYGGLSSPTAAVNKYKEDSPAGRTFRYLMEAYNIGPSQLAAMKNRMIYKGDGWWSFGMQRLSGQDIEEGHGYDKDHWRTYYRRPLGTAAHGSYSFAAMCGSTSDGREFCILKGCGNLEIKELAPRKKVMECNRLDILPSTTGTAGQTTFRLGVWSGKVENTKISGYKYVITGPETQTISGSGTSTWRNVKFSKPGTYSVKAYLIGSDFTTGGSGKCVGTIKVNPAPQPTAACRELTIKNISRTEFQLNASATVTNGATIKGYNYAIKNDASGANAFTKNVSSSALTNSINATLPNNTSLTTDAKYTANVVVATSIGDKTASTCSKPITIPKRPVCPTNPNLPADDPNCKDPSASCDLLTAVNAKDSNTKYTLTTRASADHTATISEYDYTVKDANGKVIITKNIKSTAKTNSVDIELPANTSIKDAAKYTASVVVKTSLGNKTSEACSTELTVPPKPVCPTNPNLPADDPNCKEMCDIPGKENLPKDDPACKEMCDIPGKEDLPKDDPECKPPVCETNPNDPSCLPKFDMIKTATNITRGNIDATTVAARAGDLITYTISVTNSGYADGTTDINDPIRDILQYANLEDSGGGELKDLAINEEAKRQPEDKELVWAGITLKPGESTTRSFTVRVKDPIPSTPEGASDFTSYDCLMENYVGSSANVQIDCPAPKVVERVVESLPKTGPGDNMIFAGILAAVVVFFYARSRQLGKEVRLVRKEFNAGTI